MPRGVSSLSDDRQARAARRRVHLDDVTGREAQAIEVEVVDEGGRLRGEVRERGRSLHGDAVVVETARDIEREPVGVVVADVDASPVGDVGERRDWSRGMRP